MSRSNSRLTSTLKKLLPRRKTSKASSNNTSEVNLTGIYNNNKYIIKVNNSEPTTTSTSKQDIGEKAWMGLVRDSDGVRGARVNRNKSFLLGSAGNKVKRSNSVLPGFLGRRPVQENRTVVEVGGGGGGPQQFPWVQQEKAKESASNVSDNHNNNSNNNNNGKNNNNRYVEHACQHGFGVRDRPCLGETGNLQSAVLNLPSRDMLSAGFGVC